MSTDYPQCLERMFGVCSWIYGQMNSPNIVPRVNSENPLYIYIYCIIVCMYVWSSHVAEYGSTGLGYQSCSWSAEQGK